MDCLASKVLKLQTVQMQKLQMKADEDTSIENIENDSEIILEKVEEQNAMDSDSDGNENSLFDLNMSAKKNRTKFNLKDYRTESIIDNENFRLEMERVLPQLKVLVKSDPRDWRTHFDQIKNLKFNIDTVIFANLL
jgi:estrogen-related receptor beta like 1